MSAFEVNFYYKADGSCPVRDFLDTLDDKMLAKLLGTISLLETCLLYTSPSPRD